MERKRPLGGGGGAAADAVPPPRKLAKVAAPIVPAGPSAGGESASANRGMDAVEDETSPIEVYQRAQLAAKVLEQARDLEKSREKIEEMQSVVAALDAAPEQAAYFMAACIEDIKLQLESAGVDLSAQVGEGGVDVSAAPLAACLLESEISAVTLSDQPQMLRHLTALFVVALENARAGSRERERTENPDAAGGADSKSQAEQELHARLRAVSDQLERYAAREKEQAIATGTLKDELDDLRSLLDIRRRKVVSLEIEIRGLRNEPLETGVAAVAASAADRGDGALVNGTGPGRGERSDDVPVGADVHGDADGWNGSVAPNAEQMGGAARPVEASGVAGPIPSDVEAKFVGASKLAAERLEELQAMLEEKKVLAAEVHRLSLDLAQREKGTIPPKDVQASVVYQTMEANLQQLVVSVESLEGERDVAVEERLQERKDAEDRLAAARAESEKEAEEIGKLVDDLRRVAESAKAEKDKWVMTYEARKMEANAAAALVEASDRRANVSESIRDKLKAANESLRREVEDARKRITESELRVVAEGASDQLPNAVELASRLEADLKSEREKCSSFIEEVESLSVMFGDLESENARLVKLLAEKESVLSKVMGDKLRGRQQLATVKEEARSLAQGREFDQEKVKNLTMQVSVSKRAVSDCTLAAGKAAEEARTLAAQLALQRKVAEDCTGRERVARAEKTAMEQERDAALELAETAKVEGQTNAFVVKRLTEDIRELKKQLEEAEAKCQLAEQNNSGSGDASGKDSLRDEIIQELMKKLHCSVCPNQPKEIALVRCGHMLSRKCVDQLIAQRSRKCPLCGTSFAQQDVLNVYLD